MCLKLPILLWSYDSLVWSKFWYIISKRSLWLCAYFIPLLIFLNSLSNSFTFSLDSSPIASIWFSASFNLSSKNLICSSILFFSWAYWSSLALISMAYYRWMLFYAISFSILTYLSWMMSYLSWICYYLERMSEDSLWMSTLVYYIYYSKRLIMVYFSYNKV